MSNARNLADGESRFVNTAGDTMTGNLIVDANVGIGTSSPTNKLDVNGSLTLRPDYATYLANSYYSGGWKYIDNGAAWGIGNNFGGPSNGVTIAQAAVNSSGANAALTWIPRLNIDSSGNVGIGTSSPSSFYSLADNLVVGTGSGGNGLTVYSGSADSGFIGFNDTVSASMQAFIQYNHSGDYMAFAPNGSEKMRIDSVGRVTMPYQPAFEAYATSSLLLPAGSDTKMTLNATRLNNGGHYSTSTGRFTAPVAGTYIFHLCGGTQSTSTNTYMTLHLRKNGTDCSAYGRGATTNGQGYESAPVSCVVYMNAGDYVEPWGYSQAGSAYWIENAFNGHLIG